MKKLALSICIMFCATVTWADEWLDVTDRFVANPNYENNNSNGWTWTGSAGSTTCNYGCQEFWNGTFDMYQTITGLSNGKYRISVSAFHRPTDNSATQYRNFLANGSATITAEIYGNSYTVPVASIYSEPDYTGYNGEVSIVDGRDQTVLAYVPNQMWTARSYFEEGKYQNQLEVEVTDGKLKMGIRNATYQNSNWTIFTGWKLEYYGTPVILTSLSFSEETVTLGRSETYQLVPVCEPELQTYSKYNFVWSSSNVSVAAVSGDGTIIGVDTGTCTITCRDTESGKSATVTVKVESEGMTSANVVINEIQVRNVDLFIDPSFNYGSWVELYNPTAKSVFLGYGYVGDAKGHKFRLPFDFGSIPANGFKNLWFDHHGRYGEEPKQVPFKLNIEGGTIILYDESGTEVTRATYPAATTRTSYARTSDGGSVWSTTGEPTPEASNNGAANWGSVQLAEPVVTPDGNFFTGSLVVSANIPAGCTLVYTTDGSTPTLANGTQVANSGTSATNKTFYCMATSIYRFRLFQEGKLPSEVVTRSYIYKNSNSYAMPVVSVVANYKDLFGADYGVYVQGNGNGRPGNGQSAACNWNMDWERAVNFEYFVPDGDGNYVSAFNQQVDFEMCGGWSRAWTPHSFKLRAEKFYGNGDKNLDYPFFSSKPYNRNKTLQLRNGGNDTSCRFKDAALQEIVRRSGLYLDCQAWQPAHIFINGTYRQVLNIREPNNKHFASANYGMDTDYIDQFEMSPDSGYVQKSGTKDAFNRWYELSKTCADDKVYQLICDSLVDIEEYLNYMAVEFYLGGTDWPQNNVKGFRAVIDDENGHPEGKFHFVLFDLDGTFATKETMSIFSSRQYYTFDKLYGIDEYGSDITGQRYSEEIEFVTIFLNMLKNEKFKKRFVDTFSLVAGSVFEPSHCRAVISEMQGIMNRALAVEGGSCNSTANSLSSNLSASRQTTMQAHVQSYLGLTGGRSVSLSANVDGGVLLVNGMEVPTGKFGGTLYGDIQVQALAPAGYRFVGWSGTDGASAAYTDIFPKGASWNYYGDGSLDGTGWSQDMSGYPGGAAPLGYGKDGVKTTLTGYQPTYYFGRTFDVTSAMIENDLLLDFVIDDGCIVYVNGVEAGRYNMPTGTVTFSTVSSTYADGNPDTGSMTLAKKLFHEGSNTICVEVHNNSTTSSDIMWDASLAYLPAVSSGTYVSADSILTLGTSAVNLQACFEALATASERVACHDFPIRVNEVSAANDVYANEFWKKTDWIELYNNTDVEIELGGLYISNTADKPTAYKIPQGTFAEGSRIPARGKRVIWADKLEDVSQLHTNFKLSNDDDMLVLVYSSAEFEANNAAYFTAHPEMKGFADALAYNLHEYNQSVGRYPDGGNAIFLMNRPTIGQENAHLTQDEFLGYDEGIQLEGQPSAIEELTIGGEREEATFEEWQRRGGVIYDLQGRRIGQPREGQLFVRGKNPQK